MLALFECEALAALGRDAGALAVATRTLAPGIPDRDLTARLRTARALALWHTGRATVAEAEARRALAAGEAALTRARALEVLAVAALAEDRLERAREIVAEVVMLSEAGASAAATVRASAIGCAVERAAWKFDGALAFAERWLQAAERVGAHAAFDALVGRGDLLTAMGHWAAASAALQRVEARFPNAMRHASVCLVKAHLARSRGDLGEAERMLAALRDSWGPDARPRLRIEAHLLASDVTLAAGDAAGSEREALDALRLADVVGERGLRSRSRVRRVHALLVAGRASEAASEARRAVAESTDGRPELRARAALALARAVWRERPHEAQRICRAVAGLSENHAGFRAVARFGEALAAAAAPEVIAERLSDVEQWGDRRVLAYCLTELRHVSVRAESVRVADTLPSLPPAPTVAVDPVTRALLDAAHAMAGEGDWPERWTNAVRSVRPVLPWGRVCFGAPALQLRDGDERPRPLDVQDLARLEVAHAARGPVVDLAAHADLRLHPTRALLGLTVAVVVPAGETWLSFELASACAVSDAQVALIHETGRLLARFAPTAVEPITAPAAALRVPGLVGDSPGMCSLVETIERAAGFDVTVHVCGETGTGKERVAQALHERSARSGRPFLAVNASSLSDELFESEMFGHLRGSFTGAVGDREGHVAAAEGGTLFLDEITDLSPRAQAKLLRLLEVKEYRRVGESRTRTADVRFVTASNVPLEQRVAEGRFRADLMYRLNRMVLEVPPLRERGADVLLLARHFLRRAAARAGVPMPVLSAEAERALRAHAWPGNVREVENVMDRLMVLGRTGRIRREDLPPALLAPATAATESLREALRGFEREHISRVLRQHGGNRSRAACGLGLTRQALVAKISRLGIDAPLSSR